MPITRICAKHKARYPEGGRCPLCRATRGGSTRAWRNTRQAAIERYGGRCGLVENGIQCPNVGTELHHLVSYAQGGSDTDENLILLCAGCHLRVRGT